MQFNTDKSVFMSFTSKSISIDNISIFLKRKRLKNVDSYKHFGVEISNKRFLVEFSN